MYRSLFLLLAIVATTYGNVVNPRVPMPDGRIVGGENTEIEKVPHQVSVQLLGSHSCGGSIIDSRTILTAAHCIYGVPASYYTIRYGSTKLNSGKTIVAERLLKNPKYDSRTVTNDVAKIILKEAIVLGSNAQPIRLADKPPKAGADAIVSGWGTTTEGGSLPNILQQVKVKIVDQKVCEQQYQSVNPITETMLCAGVVGGGKDACQGDSGGPLVVNGTLAGIVSWGLGCARPTHAGVYSNVANLRSWIDNSS